MSSGQRLRSSAMVTCVHRNLYICTFSMQVGRVGGIAPVKVCLNEDDGDTPCHK